MKLARIHREYTACVPEKNLDLLEQGLMESLGNDDVSSLNARKCVAGNDDVKAGNARRNYGYCDFTTTVGFVRVNFNFF